MFFESAKLKQLEIYFLFMHADGDFSPSEMKHLNDIIEKEKLSEATMQEFQTFCGQMTLKLSTGNTKIVIDEIDELLGEKKSSFLSLMFGSIDSNKTIQAQTVWTLINLGYADSEYSEAEKEVVNHLVNRWSMDSILLAELNDTAETILALTLQKKWILNTSRLYAENNSIVQELDRSIESMFANVETSISEANIA